MPTDDRREPAPPDDDCIVPFLPVPAGELGRYSAESDPHSESDIADYVNSQTLDQTVLHVEKIKEAIVLDEAYAMWDVTTDKDRWWVLTNLTNLYSQRHFPSLDYTLSFHIGFMARLRSRSDQVDRTDPTPFDEVCRRIDQAEYRLERAVEPDEFQAVGMHLRESLISLIYATRRCVELPAKLELPREAHFVAWSELLIDHLCGGSSNKKLRRHVKNISKDTWQLVNWLTHDRCAAKTAASVAIHSCRTTIGHFIQVFERSRTDKTEECPVCKSRNIRSHFDLAIKPNGDYYLSCGACSWTNHSGQGHEI